MGDTVNGNPNWWLERMRAVEDASSGEAGLGSPSDEKAGANLNSEFRQFRSGTTGRTLLLLGRDNFIPDCNLVALKCQAIDIELCRINDVADLASVSSPAVLLIDEFYLSSLSPEEEAILRRSRERVIAVVDDTDPHFCPTTYGHVTSSLVSGVLSMNVRLEIWLPTVELFLRGAEFVPSSFLRAHHVGGQKREQADAADSGISLLSERERQVLQMLSAGWSNRAIARQCHLSEHTVKVHVRNVIKKLKATNRTAAAAIFLRGIAPTIGQLAP